MRRRRLVALGISLSVALPLSFLSSAATAAPAAAKPYDFNGDGYPELVAGAPDLKVGSVGQAGELVVLPGSTSGLASTGQQLSLATPGVAGEPQDGERFGSVFASADFDRDGFADLAVGRPRHDGQDGDFGAVSVLYGSAKGLSGARSKELLEPDGSGYDTDFGAALAVADFDGDGYPELAVGTPGAYFDDDGGGAVTIFAGGAGGFSGARSSLLRGKNSPVTGDDEFGSALAVADLDQDERLDLVVGARSGAPTSGDAPGSVSGCYGTAQGLGSCVQLDRSPLYTGFDSLAVGNVSGSARPEIVVGVDRTAGDAEPDDGGTVNILSLSGTRTGTTVSRVRLTQASPGVPGADESNDDFGHDVVLGDLDHDGFDDLVIGVPGEKSKGHRQAGRVGVVYGGETGYRRTGNRTYDQNSKGIPGKVEYRDLFGQQVSLLDHDADGRLDLSIGAPGENGYEGSVTSLRGSGSSFSTKKVKAFTLKNVGSPAPDKDDDPRFGAALGR